MFYVESIEGKSETETNAILSHRPEFRATCGGKPFSDIVFPGGDATQSLKTLGERARKIQEGDMAGVEATLIAQTDTLDTIYLNPIIKLVIFENFH